MHFLSYLYQHFHLSIYQLFIYQCIYLSLCTYIFLYVCIYLFINLYLSLSINLPGSSGLFCKIFCRNKLNFKLYYHCRRVQNYLFLFCNHLSIIHVLSIYYPYTLHLVSIFLYIYYPYIIHNFSSIKSVYQTIHLSNLLTFYLSKFHVFIYILIYSVSFIYKFLNFHLSI